MESGDIVGVDDYLMTSVETHAYVRAFEDKNIVLKAIRPNLVDKVWGQDQPAHPANPVVPLEEKYTG